MLRMLSKQSYRTKNIGLPNDDLTGDKVNLMKKAFNEFFWQHKKCYLINQYSYNKTTFKQNYHKLLVQ